MNKNLISRLCSIFLISPFIIALIHFNGLYFKLLLILLLIIGIYEILFLNFLHTKVFVFFLLIFFLISTYFIRDINNGEFHLFFIILITWLSDSGGYIFGKYIGGKKINIISPNKTYSGFIGSLIFSQFSLFFAYEFNVTIFDNLILDILFVTFCSTIVIFGDLFFSYIKRKNKIKDFSNIIPGHGGLFDRIDGMIFLAIFYNLFVIL